jgi:hypothetical protein
MKPGDVVAFCAESGTKHCAKPFQHLKGSTVMRTNERFEREFSGFSGGVSGFGDVEFAEIIRDESEFPGTGLTVSSLQSVAYRQLIGSVVVLAVVAIFALFTALRLAHTSSVVAVNHSFPSVQQPILETPASDRFAAVKHRTELP